MKVQKRRLSGICRNLLFVMLLLEGSSALAYESLEWQKNGMFGNISVNKSTRNLTAMKIEKVKPSKLGKIQSPLSKKKSSRLNALQQDYEDSNYRLEYTSLGNTIELAPLRRKSGPSRPSQSQKRTSHKTNNRVIWAASSSCLNRQLRSAIYHVARNWGRVRVNSTCRSRRHNRRVGGSKYSYHLSGQAADIRVWGNVKATARYLRKIAGGYKHYGYGLFHIDTGPRRTW